VQLDVLHEFFFRLRCERTWAVRPGIDTPDRVRHRSPLAVADRRDSRTGRSQRQPTNPAAGRIFGVTAETPTLSLFRQKATMLASTAFFKSPAIAHAFDE
jgi:hypothetical protein